MSERESKMKRKVAVAMSGGVDSSVCAALLKEKGYEVIGVTMQIWPGDKGEGRLDRHYTINIMDAAKRIADELGIPHYMLNLRDVFEKYVTANFCDEYRKGETPNPCIRCNKYIKFGALLKMANQLGADYLATGHYAKIEYNEKTGEYLLKKGADLDKDQSYFLYTMSQSQLKNILMPLGDYTKDEVRAMARDFNLPILDREESQEICFIPTGGYPEFLKRCMPEAFKPGPILNTRGEILGEHKGVLFYTIGQRRGLGISSKTPLYVVAIDGEKNAVIVGTEDELYSDELKASEVNYITTEGLKEPARLRVRIRYRHKEAEAMVYPTTKNEVRIKFAQPQRAITPGQAAVFYDGDIVVGGGVIRRSTQKSPRRHLAISK